MFKNHPYFSLIFYAVGNSVVADDVDGCCCWSYRCLLITWDTFVSILLYAITERDNYTMYETSSCVSVFGYDPSED